MTNHNAHDTNQGCGYWEMINAREIEQKNAGVRALFEQYHAAYDAGSSYDEAWTDLVADLMHLHDALEREGLLEDPERTVSGSLSWAEYHYEAEVAEGR